MNTLVAPAPFQVSLPDGRLLRFQRPEDLVRACAVAAAAGAVYPSPQTVAWLAGSTPAYDNSSSYWHPYGSFGTNAFVHAWARGAYGYEVRSMVEPAPVELVDPSVWYSRIKTALDGLDVPDRVAVAFELAHEQTNSVGPYSDEVVALWTAVRQAQQSRRLLIDPAKIKKALLRSRADER